MKKLKERIRNYIKNATWWNWVTNIAFLAIILILVIPSWRLSFQKMVLGWTLSGPDLQYEITEQRIPSSWIIYSVDDEPVSFEVFQNKKVFMNFWASWCAPCLAEMPSLMDSQKQLDDEVAFIFITKDAKHRAMKIVNDYPDRRENFYFYKDYPAYLRHRGIPFSVWIDHGMISARFMGSAKWSAEDIRKGFR